MAIATLISCYYYQLITQSLNY